MSDLFNDDELLDAELLLALDALDEPDDAAAGAAAAQFDPLHIARLGAVSAPLSFAQQRLWFFEELEPGTAFFNMPVQVRLAGRLDVAALTHALNDIVRRHESLRTVFALHDGAPRQCIAARLELALPLTDLRALAPDEREARALQLMRESARQPFDLGRGPLLRAGLLRLADGHHVVMLTMHHIVSDGWSMGVLVREFAALYRAFAEGRPSPLPELPVQYADYAAWQRHWLAGDVLEGAARLLAAASSPARRRCWSCPPTGRARRCRATAGRAASFVLPPDAAARRCRRWAGAQEATLFMTAARGLQRAAGALLGGTGRFRRGLARSPTATAPETEELIGFFVNTLVLRSRSGGEPSFAELLRQVRETALGAYAHQDVPFEQLVEALEPERDASHTPLFQVMLAVAERTDSDAGPARPVAAPGAGRAVGGQVRPDPVSAGTRWPAGWRF